MDKNTVLYKSFDSSDFLFEIMWKLFPNILTQKDSAERFTQTLVLTSREFCSLKESGYFKIRTFTQGGFGAVGEISIEGKPLTAAIFSFNPYFSDRNAVTNTPVIIKYAIQPSATKVTKISLTTISISDPLSDMLFGSMLGHLYDIGICPFVPKYFGTYSCGNTETSMIIEKADSELYAMMLKRNISGSELRTLLYQFVYTMYVLKSYFGFVHFDTHLRNLMVVSSAEYTYHGSVLGQKMYAAYETGLVNRSGLPMIVVMPMPANLLKIIDFGCSLACFDRSAHAAYKRDLRVVTDYNNINMIGAGGALEGSLTNHSYANTVDIMFTIINVYEFGRIQGVPEYSSVADEMCTNLFGTSARDFLVANPQFVTRTVAGRNDWFMRNHSTGLSTGYSDLKFIPSAMCKGANGVKEAVCVLENTPYNGKRVAYMFHGAAPGEVLHGNTLFLSHNTTKYSENMNRFISLVKVEQRCKQSEKIYCKLDKMYRQYPVENIIDSKIVVNDANMSVIKHDKEANYPNKKLSRWLNASLTNQSAVRNIRFTIVTLNKPFKTAKLYRNDNLTKANRSPSLAFPIGIDAVFGKTVQPLGYSATRDASPPVVYHHFPNAYQMYLGVVVLGEDNRLGIERYTDFVRRHTTSVKKEFINKKDKEESEIIDIPVELKGGKPYKWAVTAGPVLVWNGRRILDESLVENATSSVVLYKNSSEKIFAGEGAGYYGLQNANEVTAHLVLVERKNRTSLVMIEGDGFLAPGLDMPDLARFCTNLGVEKAICIKSGVTVNMAIADSAREPIMISKSHVYTNYGGVVVGNF
ncbi:hypothetical protein AV955_gp046 [Diadromus pulchellus ascovirus 4a]|uniref:Complete DpAV4 genome n=1 Tax=Diadromus pulchellus ascovirus 4a TaxID=158683 RepID=F2NYX5_9VIRU|nr:hypothetical protein AV955_gp046 [Diadromus pulchellus ascovirus 4a]CCA61403.1 unnamed protein product [Diadromus pulchellus ascovirus 4a]